MMNGGRDFPSIFSSREKRYNSSKQGEGSFRVLYYGGSAGSVPFLWESRPGTPKHKFDDGPLPPLTPPPQYQSSPAASPTLKKKHSSKIFNSIFARTPSKKMSAPTSPSPPSSSSSNSSSYSLPSTPFHCGKDDKKARLRSIVKFELDDDDRYDVGADSPTSTLCFRTRNGSSSRMLKGYYYYPIKSVKKVVKSIAGRSHF